MRCVRLSGAPPGAEGLVSGDCPKPQPGPGEVQIRVRAVGVTPDELQWYPTTHLKTGEPRIGAVPGHEFSGVITEVGKEVPGLEIGQEVYGMNDWFSEGATAEYCLSEPSAIAPKPPNLTHVEAASVPISALSAWQGLFDRTGLQPGERVLVHGGSGAVGMFAVQLARHRGARVIATASEAHLGFVSQLGAEQVIDYRTARFEDEVQSVDVVFDTVGGETLERSWEVLGPGGRMITVASQSAIDESDRVQQAFFIVEPNENQLKEVGSLLETGSLLPLVGAVVPLSNAAAAYSNEVAKTHDRGKLIVEVAA